PRSPRRGTEAPRRCGSGWRGRSTASRRSWAWRTTGMSERPVMLLRAELRQRWQRGERVQVECYLDQLPTLRADSEAVLDLIYQEILLRQEAGEVPRQEAYLARFPQHAEQLRLLFEVHDGMADPDATVAPTLAADGAPAAPGSAWLAVGGYEIEAELGRGGM